MKKQKRQKIPKIISFKDILFYSGFNKDFFKKRLKVVWTVVTEEKI